MPSTEITPSFAALPERGLIRVSGEDAFKFLQNIITNDLSKLIDGQLLHSCLLTAQGKFLHDFFVSKKDDAYLLDCEGGERAKDLLKRLSFYRLRAKVTLELQDNISVYAVFGQREFKDPRHDALGSRVFEKPDLPEVDFAVWNKIRITRSIADGSRDAEIEKSTLSELNMEESSIDYKKGCYIGQELTARIHHRGLAKKHLFPVRFEGDAPPRGTPLFNQGKTAGDMRSSQGNIGLALLKDEVLPSPTDGFYMLDINP